MTKKLIIIFCCLFCTLLQARPEKLYGLYISRWTMMLPARLQHIADKAAEVGLNTLVCDYNGEHNQVYKNNLQYARDKNIYLIARVEVFPEGGADFSTFVTANTHKKIEYAKQAETLGFNEVQFDYIRFKDVGEPLQRKKIYVENFLRTAAATLNIPVQIDVFGSVAYHPHNIIGQDLGRISDIVSAVCPMLYPSHFYLDKKRMSQPYETMLEGCTLAKQQINGRPVKLIPYIQGFNMKLSYSGLTLKEYIIAQIKAVKAANADGFFVWNAENSYSATYDAIKDLAAQEQKQFIFF